MAHNLYPTQALWRVAKGPSRSWLVGLIVMTFYGALLPISRVLYQLLKMKSPLVQMVEHRAVACYCRS